MGNAREKTAYRVAVVEDDVLMQRMLGDALRLEGWECVICPDAAAALERLPAEKPDLVLLDVNLPDGDGHDVCRRLKADERTRAIPIVMLTGEARALEQRVRGLELGADDYLFKPVSPKVLVARARSILAASGGRRA